VFDDVLITFDDERAEFALPVMAELSRIDVRAPRRRVARA
jgi:uncharacterized protein YhaN